MYKVMEIGTLREVNNRIHSGRGLQGHIEYWIKWTFV